MSDTLTYESRFKIPTEFFDILESFELSLENLKEFEAYPFGGFVRDLYHRITPQDLDLLIPSMGNLFQLAGFLKAKGWQVWSNKTQPNTYFGSEADPNPQKLKFRFLKDNYQIDLISSKKVVKPLRFDFYANAFAIDPFNEQIFYWVIDYNASLPLLTAATKSIQRPSILKNAFEILNQKQIVAWQMLRDVHISKIGRFLQQGWNLHLENFLVFSNLQNLRKEYAKEFSNLPGEIKKQILVPYLTNSDEFIRESVRFLMSVDNFPGTIFLDTLLNIAQSISVATPFKGFTS